MYLKNPTLFQIIKAKPCKDGLKRLSLWTDLTDLQQTISLRDIVEKSDIEDAIWVITQRWSIQDQKILTQILLEVIHQSELLQHQETQALKIIWQKLKNTQWLNTPEQWQELLQIWPSIKSLQLRKIVEIFRSTPGYPENSFSIFWKANRFHCHFFFLENYHS